MKHGVWVKISRDREWSIFGGSGWWFNGNALSTREIESKGCVSSRTTTYFLVERDGYEFVVFCVGPFIGDSETLC